MRTTTVTTLGCALALLLLGGGPLSAQTKSAGDIQVADLTAMKEKFVALAEAVPADRYDWRPGEGVRSFRDVFSLIAAELYYFPPQWGLPAPPEPSEFRESIARFDAMPKADFVAAFGAAFDYAIGSVGAMDQAAASRVVNFFRQDTSVRGAVTLASYDMHEHLGQLIAYARVNGIVPPWSRRGM